MLALLLTFAIFAQGHDGDGSGSAGVDRPRLLVRGTVELSAGEANAAAESLVADRARGLLAERGRATLGQSAPVWLPSFSREQLLRRWLAGVDGRETLRVVDRTQVEHDHGGLGTSYRTELFVEPDGKRLATHLSRLRRQVAVGARVFAIKCGGIVGFWVLLAAVVGWVDRLSRGYMTWRLRVLGLIAGSALPAVVLLLV